VNSSLIRTGVILSALFLGILVPQAHVAAPYMRWLVLAMLFLVFLQTRFSRAAFQRSHLKLFAANIVIAFAAWGVALGVTDRDIALSAFFAGITPTATAAPVIIGFLGGRVDYVVTALLLSNLGIAALLPMILPLVLGRSTSADFAHVLGSVALVVFIPMAIAWGLRAIHPPAFEWPKRLRNISFGMWMTMLFVITANASQFVRQHTEVPHATLLQIAGFSLAVCATSFATGRWIGGKEFPREASQSLGQKNTAFTIYLALLYTNPLVALGPTCYIVWHNLWNSWQLHRLARREIAAQRVAA
jgi:bile acid:Na+ symporter, BASS family